MNNSIIFRAAKCVTCVIPSTRSRILCARQQASILQRPPSAFSTAGTRLSSTFAKSASPQPSPASQSAVGNGAVSSQTNTFISRLTGPTCRGTSLLTTTTSSMTQTRGRAEIYYRPSAWKRVNKHGMEKRLMTPGGIEVLWRRILKKRHCLTPFDRILPGTYKGKILPDHHLKYNKHLVSRDVRKRMKEAIRRK